MQECYKILELEIGCSLKELQKQYVKKCFAAKNSSEELRLVIDAYEEMLEIIAKSKLEEDIVLPSVIKIYLTLEDLLTKSQIVSKQNGVNIVIPLLNCFVKDFSISVGEVAIQVLVSLVKKDYKGCSFYFDSDILMGFTLLNKSIQIDEKDYKLRKDKQSIFYEEAKQIYNFNTGTTELLMPDDVDTKRKILYFFKKGMRYLHPLTGKVLISDLLISYQTKKQ